MFQSNQPSGKKEYHSPKITEYGNITELTQTAGPYGNPDGGVTPNDFTSATPT